MRCAAERQERNVKYLEVHREPADIRDMSEAYVGKGMYALGECGKTKHVFEMKVTNIFV